MEQPSDDRYRVQRALATVHGEEIAALCMDLMPNVDTTQLSSRSDLETAVVLVRKDMDHGFAALRTDMDHRFAEMQQTMDHRFSEMQQTMSHGFAEVRSEMRAGFAEQGKLLAEQISSSVNQSLRWSIVTMVSMQAVLVAAIRLL
jgi:DNA anti-recombination protein RmuC